MRWPLIVNTTGLVIVVSGLNVREEEPKDVGVSEGVGVVDGSSEDIEGLDELLSRVVVEGSVVVGGCEVVEGGCVEVGSGVLVLGDSLVGGGGGCLSTQISGQISSDEWLVRSIWCFRGRRRGCAHVAVRDT